MQVAYLVAQGILRKMGTHFHNVERPHGAETGFDPHAGYTSVTEDNYYEFTHGAMLGPEAPSEWQHRCAGGVLCGSDGNNAGVVTSVGHHAGWCCCACVATGALCKRLGARKWLGSATKRAAGSR